MSRQNKVNPGMYTQRGRLTQDDAARELKRQRSIGSEHTWQPSKKDQFPRLASDNDDEALGAETSGDKNSEAAAAEKPKAKTAKTATTKSGKTTKAKTAKTAKSKTAKKTARKAGTAKPAAKRAAGKTSRTAVLARNVGGGGPKPRSTAKRRKS
jgi:hypothetical protein